MRKICVRFLAVFLINSLILLNGSFVSICFAQQNTIEQTTQILHKPLEQVEAGRRLVVYVEIEDPKIIETVRVYFKTKDGANYNFVPLHPVVKREKDYFDTFKSIGSNFNGESFSGQLPAFANGVGSFEYLILVKNFAKVVVKSQTYSVNVIDSTTREEHDKDPITIYSEMNEKLQAVEGFSDNIVVDSVESSAKLGGVAGLYYQNGSSNGNSSSAAQTATNGGTVAASAGGFTTTSIVIGAATAVAVVGGIAAVAGGGGGGSSSGTYTGECPYVGNWGGTYTETNCFGSTFSGRWSGTVNSSCFFSGFDSGGQITGSINPSTGAASLSGTEGNCGPVSGSARFSGNSVTGSFSGSGVTGTFSGSR